jgi:hypothetical protein
MPAQKGILENAELLLLALIIDDGNKSRSNRKGILDCSFQHVGIGILPVQNK